MLLHLPHMILLTQWTQQDITALIFLLVVFGIHFLLRTLKHTSFAPIYKAWCAFWFILFLALTANLIRDEIKKWWNN